jgi:hypothetical protein
MVVGANPCKGSDSSNRLRLDHEVLTERPTRGKTMSLEQLRGLRASECHQVMDTGIGAFTRSDNSTNKRVCNTTVMLAGVDGIITLEHAMERPLLRFFTTSVVP